MNMPSVFSVLSPWWPKLRFLVKKWRFWGGVKNVKNQFFFLVHLYISKSSRKQCTLRFFVFGPLVAKNGVFRYRPPIFGGQKNVANQNFISYICLVGPYWWVSGGCLKGVWRVSGRCLKPVWKVSGRCLEGIWKARI